MPTTEIFLSGPIAFKLCPFCRLLAAAGAAVGCDYFKFIVALAAAGLLRCWPQCGCVAKTSPRSVIAYLEHCGSVFVRSSGSVTV